MTTFIDVASAIEPASSSSPTSEATTVFDTVPSPSLVQTTGGESTESDSELSDVEEESSQFAYEYEGQRPHRIIRILPTKEQWEDFPGILKFARKIGAEADGCFKLVLPKELQHVIPPKSTQPLRSNAYKVKLIRSTSFWQVHTIPSTGVFDPYDPKASFTGSVDDALKKLKTQFRKNKDRQMREVRYRPDVPAWTPEQRQQAGVPEKSPIHPLQGDKLNRTKAIIPGIHVPYVYESAAAFGAMFQIHAEDYRLLSLNHLYKGRKIWIVTPCTTFEGVETAFGRQAGCSQFMRHRAEFFFPDKLDKMKIEYRIVDQRPGETMVILPDAYHEGFSTGYTLAEAKNYADHAWDTESYAACEAKCEWETAIQPEQMRLINDNEERIDLCTAYMDSLKHQQDETSEETETESTASTPKPVPTAVPVKDAETTVATPAKHPTTICSEENLSAVEHAPKRIKLHVSH